MSRRIAFSAVLGLMGLAVLCGAMGETAGVETNAAVAEIADQGFVVDDTKDDFTRLELLKKPATFDSFGQRLDFIQNNLTAEMQGYIDDADRIFVKDAADLQPIPSSRFRLGTYVEFAEDRGFTLKFDPDFQGDIKLPNLESQLNVFLDTAGSDELPGTTVSERERGFNAGLRKATRHFNFDAGVKVKWLPELFGRVDWRPKWTAAGFKMYPVQRLYWESDDGYGSVSSFDIDKVIGKRWLISSTSAMRWREKSNNTYPPEDPEDPEAQPEYYAGDLGFEWEQSFSFGYVQKVISVKDRGKMIDFQAAAKATGIRASAFGHTQGEYAGPDRYRITFGHRRPIYRNWMFLSIMPEVEWYKEYDWEFVPRLRIGIDMLLQAEAVSSRAPGS